MPDLFSDDALRPYVQAALQQATTVQDVAGAAPAKKKKGIGPWPYVAMAAGQGADAASTVYALSQPNTYEANPVMAGLGPAGIAATKIGVSALIGYAIHQLSQKHPDMAQWLGYVIGAGTGALAANNVRIARQQQR